MRDNRLQEILRFLKALERSSWRAPALVGNKMYSGAAIIHVHGQYKMDHHDAAIDS